MVVLLDGERAGRPSSPPRPRLFDNRYAQNVDLLPAPRFLWRQGIQRAVILGSGAPAEDLRPYVERLLAEGVEVDTKRVGALARAGR